jgi:hypothetical protein
LEPLLGNFLMLASNPTSTGLPFAAAGRGSPLMWNSLVSMPTAVVGLGCAASNNLLAAGPRRPCCHSHGDAVASRDTAAVVVDGVSKRRWSRSMEARRQETTTATLRRLPAACSLVFMALDRTVRLETWSVVGVEELEL